MTISSTGGLMEGLTFEITPSFIIVTFPYASDFERSESEANLNGTVIGTVIGADLSKTQESILLLINTRKGITIEQMATELAVSRRTILRSIKILTDKNIIKRTGSDKTGQWELANSAQS